MKTITQTDYLMGRAGAQDLDAEHQLNMLTLLKRVNDLLTKFGAARRVNSGYRRAIDNKACGGSPRSAHLSCQAIDLEDKDGKLKEFCTDEVLKEFDLYMEHPDYTPSWCHLQTRKTKWGNRVFKPY